jgi:hypothetical protein
LLTLWGAPCKPPAPPLLRRLPPWLHAALDEAAEHDEVSAKYTLAGATLNAAAITSWAAVYELGFGRAARRGNVSRALLGGVATAAVAYVVDYYVVPRRLTPGFEKRLSSTSMFAAYAALAASLPLASLLHSKRR